MPRYGGFRPYGGEPAGELDENNWRMTLSNYEESKEIVAAPSATPGPEPDQSDAQPPAQAKELTADAVSELLTRVPPISSAEEDEKGFAAREASFKPPKTGNVITVPFPPPPEARPEMKMDPNDLVRLSKAEAGPLKVDRYTPSGGVSHAAAVSISFSQPMVNLSSVDDVKAQNVGNVAIIEPLPPGRWLWKGVKTLQFESPDGVGRLPASTTYNVKVPVGTTSVLGGKLDTAVTFQFTTEAVKSSYPGSHGYTGLSPVVFILFNQRINPEAVMANTTLTGGKSNLNSSSLQIVPEAELKGNEDLTHYLSNAQPGYWIAFRPKVELTKGSRISVNVAAASISAEGPNKCTPLSFTFNTYPLFGIRRENCWPNQASDPKSQWCVGFSTPPSKASFKKEMVTIKPDVKAKFQLNGASLQITPEDAVEKTTYKVTISRSLQDTFGQSLIEHDNVSFSTSTRSYYPSLSMTSDLVVLDPVLQRAFHEVAVTNYTEVVVEISQAEPFDYLSISRNFYNWTRTEKGISKVGRLVHTETVPVKGKPDEVVKLRVNLQPHLQHAAENLGHVVLVVYPTKATWEHFHGKNPHMRYEESRTVLWAWIASTQLGVDAVRSVGPNSVDAYAWVNGLKDGAPVVGANVITRLHAGATYAASKPAVRQCPQKHNLIFMIPGAPKTWKCADCAKPFPSKNKAWHCSKCNYDMCEDCHKKPPPAPTGVPTDASGIAKIAFLPPGGASQAERGMLIASKGNDIAFVMTDYLRKAEYGKTAVCLFNDRGLYRPKEDVYIKGYLRSWLRDGETVRPQFITPTGEVTYKIHDPRGQEWAKGTITLNKFSAFSVKVTLPDNVNLGNSYFTLTCPSADGPINGTLAINVEEFRRPEYECKATVRPLTGHISASDPLKGGFAIANVKASYFSGGALSDARVVWNVSAASSSYSPPGWSEYSFGNVKRWWGNYSSENKSPLESATHEAKSNDSGEHEVKIQYIGNYKKKPTPITVTARAQVIDLNNQSIETNTTFIVHPSNLYVGTKLTKWYAPKEEALSFEVIVTNHDGKLVAGQTVTATAERKWGEYKEDAQGVSKWTQSKESRDFPFKCGAEVTSWKFQPWEGGSYNITFTVADANGLKNTTTASGISIMGAQSMAPVESDSTQLQTDALVLIPDKEEYKPGDIGEVLVQSPFAPAEGYLTITADAVVYSKRFRLASFAEPVTFPIDVNWVPNATVHVSLVGKKPRGGPAVPPGILCLKRHALARLIPYEGKGWNCDACSAGGKAEAYHCEQCGYDLCDKCYNQKKQELPATGDAKTSTVPALAEGQMAITISRHQRVLTVGVESGSPHYRPGADAKLSIQVNSFDGKPVPNAELCLICADESVVSLSGHSIKNPVELFYPHRGGFSGAMRTLEQLNLRNNVWILREAPEPEPEPEPVAADLNEGGESSEGEEKSEDYGGAPGGAPMRSGGRSKEEAGKMALMSSLATGAPPAAPRMMMFKSSSSSGEGGGDKRRQKGSRQRRSSIGGGGDDGDGFGGAVSASGPVELRKNFSPIGKFEESIITDEQGKASLTFKLPDSLTRYRVWAVAVTDILYGVGEGAVNVQMPLMVRPSPPRFLNFGDKADISVVLINQLPGAVDVKVAVRVSNAKLREGFAGGWSLRLNTGQRGALLFPVTTKKPGVARFQVVAASSSNADAAEFELPVWTPATTEAFATYGDVADTAVIVQPIQTPSNVVKEFGGLEVSTSSTALQALTDAVIELIRYPLECSEQLASRVLGVIGLKDILSAFNVKDIPSPAKLIAQLNRDINGLRSRQYSNGGFGFWSVYSLFPPSPYVSCHVSHMLGRAKSLGLDVSQPMFDSALRFIKSIESHFLGWYGRATRASICAYAVYARARMEDATLKNEPAEFYKKYEKDFSLEGLAWILVALQYAQTKNKVKNQDHIAAILRHLANKATETADTASFITSYGDDGTLVMLHSDRRTDAVVLDALLDVDSKNSLIPKIVKGLLAHRKRGKWQNTQENCFILVALDHYFKVYEKDTPDFVASIWLGDTYAGEQKFKGRSTDTNLLNVPMQYLFQNKDPNFVLQKEGVGRLYYRLGLSYAPTDLKLNPACYGFKVERQYEGVDNKADVKLDEKGVYRIKLGAKVKVTLKLIAIQRRYHVALIDKLPAGFEALNPALPGTPTVPPSDEQPMKRRWFDPVNWFDFQNIRDERVEAFKDLLWEGVYTYSYYARATTAGEFVVPPAKAEEMYSPEIFGRTGTAQVIVA